MENFDFFCPEPRASGFPTGCRRVIISDLPRDIHLYQLLPYLGPGVIIKANLVDTTSITDSITAIVEYKSPQDAENILSCIQTGNKTVAFLDQDRVVVRAKASLAGTYSYPPTLRTFHTYFLGGATRTLVVGGVRRRLVWLILICGQLHLPRNHEKVVDIEFTVHDQTQELVWDDQSGDLRIEFSSVKMAVDLWFIVSRVSHHHQLKEASHIAFATDRNFHNHNSLLTKDGFGFTSAPVHVLDFVRTFADEGFLSDPLSSVFLGNRTQESNISLVSHRLKIYGSNSNSCLFSRQKDINAKQCRHPHEHFDEVPSASVDERSDPPKQQTFTLFEWRHFNEEVDRLSPAYCPRRIAAAEARIIPWTHRDPQTGVVQTRVPWGWMCSVENHWKEIEAKYLETDDPFWMKVLDNYYDSRGRVNLRKMVVLGRGRCWPCPANLWGILKG